MKTKDLINLVWLITFSALTVFSLIIHSLTYVGHDPRKLSAYLWWGLQFSSAFALVLALILQGIENTFFKREEFRFLPPVWPRDKLLVTCLAGFMFYGLFNWIFTDVVLLHTATPEIVNGQYAVGSHGFFTPVSKEQFAKAMVYEARMNSGHWMAFFLLALTALRWKASD